MTVWHPVSHAQIFANEDGLAPAVHANILALSAEEALGVLSGRRQSGAREACAPATQPRHAQMGKIHGRFVYALYAGASARHRRIHHTAYRNLRYMPSMARVASVARQRCFFTSFMNPTTSRSPVTSP